MPSGVVEETLLRVDDSPLLNILRFGYLLPRDDDGVRYRAGHSYSRKRVKQRTRKGTMDYVDNSSDD